MYFVLSDLGKQKFKYFLAPPGMPPIPFMPPPVGDSVISAEPMVHRTVDRTGGALNNKQKSDATISAEPKLRDLAKEVTKFVPTALRVHRNKPVNKRPLNKYVSPFHLAELSVFVSRPTCLVRYFKKLSSH